jgi:peptide/nickel transport system substrate-binding protein
VTSTTAIDKYTVAVTLSSPDSAFLSYLAALQCGLMVSPTAYSAEGSGFANNPIGTGPYKFASGTPGTTATFDRWNGYWGGKPYLNSVTINETTSDSIALDDLETGAAQIMPLAQDVYSQAAAQPSLQINRAPAASINYVTFSYTHAPFDNPEAREAIFYATNAASIRSNLYQNFYPTVEGVLPPSDIGYLKTVKGYINYDLAQAQQLVAKLGGLSFALWTGNSSVGVTEAEALAAMWQAAGMHVSITAVATAALIAADHAHTYDALLITSPASSSSDQTIYRFFYSGSPINQGGMVDPVLNKWILEARRTYRVPAQQALYQKINTRLEAVDYAWMDLYSAVTYQALSKNVVNFPDDPFGYHYWATTYLK